MEAPRDPGSAPDLIAFYICFFVWFGMAPLASSMLKA